MTNVKQSLANIVLHYVLDEWFAKEVRPRLKGEAFLIRYADDFVIGVAREDDARRIMEVLPKRMSKYGLTVHPEKTRVVRFHPADVADSEPSDQNSTGPRTFDFLGFTHYWGRSRRGGWVVKRKTAKGRLKRALDALAAWCRENLHLPIGDQHQKLTQKLGNSGVRGGIPVSEHLFGWEGEFRCQSIFSAGEFRCQSIFSRGGRPRRRGSRTMPRRWEMTSTQSSAP